MGYNSLDGGAMFHLFIRDSITTVAALIALTIGTSDVFF